MIPKKSPVYLMIPRKLIIAWLVSTVVLMVMIIASFQYANYVDRKSNSYWCGIVLLFTDTYKKKPPPTETGKILAHEFQNLRTGFGCK